MTHPTRLLECGTRRTVGVGCRRFCTEHAWCEAWRSREPADLRLILELEFDTLPFCRAAHDLARAQVLPDVVAVFRMERITVFQKPGGGVRGIVCGDIMRKLVHRRSFPRSWKQCLRSSTRWVQRRDESLVHMQSSLSLIWTDECLFAYFDDIHVVCPRARVCHLQAFGSGSRRERENPNGKSLCRLQLNVDPHARVWRGGGPSHEQGIRVLEISIGHVDFVQAQLRSKTEMHKVLHERFWSVQDLQSAWLVLLFSANARARIRCVESRLQKLLILQKLMMRVRGSVS